MKIYIILIIVKVVLEAKIKGREIIKSLIFRL